VAEGKDASFGGLIRVQKNARVSLVHPQFEGNIDVDPSTANALVLVEDLPGRHARHDRR